CGAWDNSLNAHWVF
nr:immunoglobulin light chain junction region [Macaca mulatta]MPN80022.1 immunoglobulin light chain junction region [Macaca mulatta]MPN80103.1 immunoglobulin light chain junction region [Macaca mulatta]MPN80166.1 immunoglobulin light chain junction region [Macaca mulatta]MPN80209.1 immunoglobulin light chain junction region [Macaca mulatta]